MAWTRGQAFYQQYGPLAKRWQAARQAHLQQDYLVVLGDLCIPPNKFTADRADPDNLCW